MLFPYPCSVRQRCNRCIVTLGHVSNSTTQLRLFTRTLAQQPQLIAQDAYLDAVSETNKANTILRARVTLSTRVCADLHAVCRCLASCAGMLTQLEHTAPKG